MQENNQMAKLNTEFKTFAKDSEFAIFKRMVTLSDPAWEALLEVIEKAHEGTLPVKAASKGKEKEGEPKPPVVSCPRLGFVWRLTV